MGKYGRIVDITGKVPGKNDVLLQSAPDDQLLKICVGEYLERVIKAEEKLDIATMQKILKARADKVKELSQYKFEPNQRIDDLIGARFSLHFGRGHYWYVVKRNVVTGSELVKVAVVRNDGTHVDG